MADSDAFIIGRLQLCPIFRHIHGTFFFLALRRLHSRNGGGPCRMQSKVQYVAGISPQVLCIVFLQSIGIN